MAARYDRREWLLRRLLAVSDCAGLLAALTLAAVISGRRDVPGFLGYGALTLPGWLMLIRAYGLYDRDPKRINCSTIDDIPGLFHVLFVGGVLLWGYYRLIPVPSFGLAELVGYCVLAGAALLTGRGLVRHTLRRRGRRRAAIVGDGAAAGLLARKLESHPEYGVRVVGSVLPCPGPATEPSAVPVLGALPDMERIAGGHDLDRLIVVSDEIGRNELINLLRRCRQSGLRVSVLPQIFDVMGPSVELDEVEGLTLLGLDPPVLSRSSRALKRTVDLLGSIVCLILAAPLLVAITVAIKLDSRGPVLFVQRRVGRGGRPLDVYKFRTMVADAEERRAELEHLSSDPNWLKLEVDPRITRIGRLLRHSSLDELPQLLNVVKGEMSLVGPRPLIEAESELIEDWGRARLDLTPGITGLWQVLGRTSIPFEEMVKLDYQYVTNWSLWSDLRLILHTLPAVLKRRGVN